MTPIRIAIVGMGKIARDQHLPAIAADDRFVLAATVSPSAPGVGGVRHFRNLETLLAGGPPIDAVALCTPPQVRYAVAAAALERGIHVFFEKPPGATLAEVAALEELAVERGAVLFASWHSRFAAGVEPARQWLAERRIDQVSVVWREDVRMWHPGQTWIWEAGGLGVFDPGINALSILTRILPHAFFLESATLEFPSNRDAPIAAELNCHGTDGAVIAMDFDFRQTGPQSWDIEVTTDAGPIRLERGGSALQLPDRRIEGADAEYSGLYARFAKCVEAGSADVDIAPLRLVADAFLRGRRVTVEPFDP